MSDSPPVPETPVVADFLADLRARNPGEEAFHQAVGEVLESLLPVLDERGDYRAAGILERLTEPDRVISFRVCWEDDAGRVHVNRGWRVQFNNAIGPYKGGLRFHPQVDTGVFKFLAFEQIFKNSLTGLPMGGAKGGADFDPRGRSQREVMRFCQAFMAELQRHIGEDVDVPAGDIGVGQREIGFLFGQYRRLANRFGGVLTGKGASFGGSPVRSEATGYGLVYFLGHMLAERDQDLRGQRVAVSGAGNVALHAIAKLIDEEAVPVTVSDSDGCVHDPDGIDADKLAWLRELKQERWGRVREYAEHFDCEYREGESPWGVAVDIALPCAIQNEVDADAARRLIDNGLSALAEGANMPCTAEAQRVLRAADVAYAPAKAANAGGVGVSGLEQSQNAQRLAWSAERVDEELRGIMQRIHERCVAEGESDDGIDYVAGANRAGFRKVADAMLHAGLV